MLEGPVRTVLRLEGLALFLAAGACYFANGGSWPLFLALFLLPDVGFAGYLWGPRAGAVTYNATHALLGPLALAGMGLTRWPSALPLALVWIAHIGLDRAIGYGLKYATGFSWTHLGPCRPLYFRRSS